MALLFYSHTPLHRSSGITSSQSPVSLPMSFNCHTTLHLIPRASRPEFLWKRDGGGTLNDCKYHGEISFTKQSNSCLAGIYILRHHPFFPLPPQNHIKKPRAGNSIDVIVQNRHLVVFQMPESLRSQLQEESSSPLTSGEENVVPSRSKTTRQRKTSHILEENGLGGEAGVFNLYWTADSTSIILYLLTHPWRC